MNFSEMGIQPNSKRLFKDGNITVIVKDDRKITYNDEIMTLTSATRKIMELDYSVQPSPYWTFEGKLLKDIYDEVYSDEESS